MPMSRKKTKKVKVCASELIDVDVQHISLVRHPANRMPFGIMKADRTGGTKMFDIDLSKLFQKSESAVVPVVTSVIVNGEVTDSILSILKEEGFSTDEPQVQGDITIFPQDAVATGNEQIVKITDSIAMAVNVVKAEGAFAERCAARGFYPSISIATDLLQDELYRAIEKSDSPGTASEKITTIVAEYGSYMAGLIGSLPTMVFKAEETIAKADSATPVVAATESDDDSGVEKSEPETPEAVETVEGEGEPAPEPVEKSEPETPAPAEPAAEAEPKIDLRTLITEVTKGVTEAISPRLDELAGKIDEQSSRITQVEEVAKSASDTVNQSVFGGVFGVEDKAERRFEKAEASDGGPLIDTGFSKLGRRGK